MADETLQQRALLHRAGLVCMPKAEADALRAVAEAARAYATPVARIIETIDRLDRLEAALRDLDRAREADRA